MGSSGGGGSSDPSALYTTAAPMEGLPVAGKEDTIGSPYEYGQFQNFLPDIKSEGQNPMATGLRPDMFQFKSPTGVTAPGGGGNGAEGGADAMRNVLAALAGGGAGGGGPMGAGAGGPMGAGAGANAMMGGGGGAGGPMGGLPPMPTMTPGPTMGRPSGAGGTLGSGGGETNPSRTGVPGATPGRDMAALHPEYARPGVAGYTAFAPWAGPNLRAGGNSPVDWFTREGAQPLIDQPKIGF